MKRHRHHLLRAAVCGVVLAAAAPAAVAAGPVNTAEPTLYVVATAHLDTQWLWTIQTTIDEYIPATLHENFELFERFPHYVFSFEGSFRYQLMEEYYPEQFERLKGYVADGRWQVCGSWVDAVDVNVPSPESLIRHVLFGNGYFEREFGRRSCDVYLPDCFGFGYALPAVAAHCGLTGFSTQKLTWGSSIGIPFDVGVWEGVDGSTVLAALNPGAYVSKVREDVSADPDWLERIRKVGEQSGAYVGYKYFGVGDRGGGPDAESVEWIEKAVMAEDSPIRVHNAPADQMYRDLTPEQIERLPRYQGEMLMTRHGTGCYTSQCAMKRWNRKNELLAGAAERASVVAHWLAGLEYPGERLEQAWTRFLWHQFHDDLTGTSIPQAYTFSWNDEIVSLNQFASTLTDAVGAMARRLDTRAEGVPLVVFNPLAFEREDVVEATVRFPGGAWPQDVRVFDAEGNEAVARAVEIEGDEARILFRARVPSVGFAVFGVRPVGTLVARQEEFTAASTSRLEGSRYRVSVDENGDVSSIFDKRLERELLAGPIRLALFHNRPDYWSEWEIRHEDITAEPYAYVTGPAEVWVNEESPCRVAIEVHREVAGSSVVQRIRLGSGPAGERLEFDHLIDWRTPETLLKAVFPLAASNEVTTYDLGFGTIERPTNTPRKYEVPAQQWADLTDASGAFGVAILNDCKYGWDKPDDHTLRLTLIHAPNNVEKDMGWHRFTYAVYGHQGDWRLGGVTEQAARLNQPLRAFQTTPHDGELGKRYSLLHVNTPQVIARAVKKAEESDEIVVRLHEAHGEPAKGVRLEVGIPIAAAREITGAEQPAGGAWAVRPGDPIELDFRPYQARTLALRPVSHPRRAIPVAQQAVPLPFDTDVVSYDADRADGDFDGAGHSLPAELFPAGSLVSGRTTFKLGPTHPGANNALACRGQVLPLPEMGRRWLQILAAAAGGPATATFLLGDRPAELTVHDFTGWVGQSDSLVVDGQVVEADRMAPGFIHRDEIAWVGTHRHDASADRNEPYVFCYLFKYTLDLPRDASTVTLPDEERIRILAMTATDDPLDETVPAAPLYDELSCIRVHPPGGLFVEPVTVTLTTDLPAAELVYVLEGDGPPSDARPYTGPFTIDRTANLSAWAVGGRAGDRQTRAAFTFTEPRPPVEPGSVVPGLAWRAYEGEWKELPEFDALTPAATGTAATCDPTPRTRDDNFGLVFEGYVRVPADGVYTFYTTSDDGSRLFIGDVLVVDNDGLHGAVERRGQIALQAGLHPLRATCFDRTGDHEFAVHYQGPGVDRQPIPADVLCRPPSSADSPR